MVNVCNVYFSAVNSLNIFILPFILIQLAVIGVPGVLVRKNGRIRPVEMAREQEKGLLNMVLVLEIQLRLGNATYQHHYHHVHLVSCNYAENALKDLE